MRFRAASAPGGSAAAAGRLGGERALAAGGADAGKVGERRRAVSMD